MADYRSEKTEPADPRTEAIRSVVIAGGGSSGWMAAMMLSTALSREIEITLVESDAIGIVGVGEATIPPLQQFNRSIKIDERDFVKATQGTFKLGIEFHNWGAIGDRYIHQFGFVGRELDAIVRLHHWWMVGRLAGVANYPAWEDVFLATAMARANRFSLPERDPQSPYSRLAYAYHFDSALYGKYLRTLAERRGVRRIEGRITAVKKKADAQGVAALVLENGQEVSGELFIDCSGFRSLLLGDELGEPFIDWSHWLPNDSALAVMSETHPDHIQPHTSAIAHDFGWQWRIPLRHRVGNGHVFASAFGKEAEAEQRLLNTLETPMIGAPRLLKFTAGRRQRHWVGNVVAVGLSAGFLEPLESTSIHLVQASLERLIELFPTRRMDPVLQDRFNEQTASEWDRVRDFIIAHFKVTGRRDSEFWRYVSAMEIPDSLSAILEVWQQRAILAIYPGHLFQTGSWSSVLIGQGLLPKGVHALADRADPAEIDRQIRAIVNGVKQAAQQLPPHRSFLDSYCA